MWVLQQEVLGAPAVSSTDLIPTGFCSQKLWGLIFLALEPWAEGLGVGWGQLFQSLCPSYQSGWMWFNSVVVRLPFNLISDGSE